MDDVVKKNLKVVVKIKNGKMSLAMACIIKMMVNIVNITFIL